ncbi:MAG: TlpA family protein disulfide reductase [Planctomycetota bacterium]
MRACLAIALLALQGGRSERSDYGVALRTPAEELHAGSWRAWLESPGGELPFGLEIDNQGGKLSATIVNGEERILVPSTTAEGADIVLDMPHYDSSIRARISPYGTRLTGEWRKRSGVERWTVMPFQAEAGDAPRFRPIEDVRMTTQALEGRFAVKFEKSDDPAVAILRPGKGTGIEGTILTTTGDYRWLAGSVEGGRLRLSCFDGAHAFLIDASLDDRGVLRGRFWSGDRWQEGWEARPDPKAALPDEFEQVRWKEGFGLADLRYPDLDGKLRSLAEPEFAGRAIVIQVLGSWCPNCHDETSYLSKVHERYRERGLSIVGLAFEHTGEFARDAEQVKRLRARHDVRYPILLAGLSDKKKASEAIPALDRVLAFPTTIFLHGDGRVRAVHSGFAGPATKEEHAKLTRRFEALIAELLAE